MSDKFEISRVFAAPRQRVWDAWTKPEQFACWFGPKGTKSEVKHFDFRPGGYLHSKVTGTDGSTSWAKNVYREIDTRRRIVWEQGWANEAGEFIPSPFPMPWPLLLRTTILFQDEGNSTLINLTWEPVDPTEEERASFAKMIPSMNGGWTGTFEQLDTFLAEPAGA